MDALSTFFSQTPIYIDGHEFWNIVDAFRSGSGFSKLI
jgi:hypothetical protein